jgi:hypothetical protein
MDLPPGITQYAVILIVHIPHAPDVQRIINVLAAGWIDGANIQMA